MNSPSRLFAACVLSSFLGGAAMFAALHVSLDARAEDRKPEKVLKAQRFEIVDANDKTIGHLGCLPDGLISLSFYDNGSKTFVNLNPMSLTLVNGENKVVIGHGGESQKESIRIQNGNDVWTQP